MTPPPTWALALIYWLHMLATVVWVGSLAAISFLILPAIKRTLNPETQLVFIEAMQRRLEPIAWFSISLLILTGLFQMSVNPHYDGFLSTSNGRSRYLPNIFWESSWWSSAPSKPGKSFQPFGAGF
jgi:uncharacterized membrane protein